MLEELSSKILSMSMRIARRFISFLVLAKAFIRRTTGPADVDARLALDIVRIRFSEALIIHNDRVQGDYVNAVMLCVPGQVQRSRI